MIENYRANELRYDRLKQEAHYILEQAILKAGIKTDNIERRVKSLDSMLRKCEARNQGITDVADIVGLRVIVLLRSDLPQLDVVVRQCFDVIEYEDKVSESAADSFGYMSNHYLCRMKAAYSGPRYDGLSDITFEVQVRTLCMHVWAAVSHYLDYKSEAQIPFRLRKELNALSGLFYVADSQFESAYAARRAASELAAVQAASKTILDEPMNLDTLTAYVNARYADRTPGDARDFAELLPELTAVGIDDLRQLEKILDSADALAAAYEKKYPPMDKQDQPTRFASLGIVRVGLEAVLPKYKALYFEDDTMMEEFLANT